MSIALIDIYDGHIVTLDAVTEIRVSLQTHDYMPIALGWHVVDQIDQAIFHAARAQAVYHVRDKIRHNYCRLVAANCC